MKMSGESERPSWTLRSYLVWGRSTGFTVTHRWGQMPAAVDQQMTVGTTFTISSLGSFHYKMQPIIIFFKYPFILGLEGWLSG